MLPYLHPDVVRGVGVIGMPHPLLARRAVSRSLLRPTRAPFLGPLPGRAVTTRALETDPGVIARLLRACSAPDSGWPSASEAETYAAALRTPFAANAAKELHRWLVRTSISRDGRRLAQRLDAPLAVPLLQMRGELDPVVPPQALRASLVWAPESSATVTIRGAGHFTHEEAPAQVDRAILTWVETIAGS